MKRMLMLISTVALLLSCSGEHPEQAAARAAKTYYDYLLDGQFDRFVAGTLRADAIPEGYREQLVANISMFTALMQAEHKGIKEVRIMNCTVDADSHTANAFLVLCFGDSTVEETVVPMVERDGKWFMR